MKTFKTFKTFISEMAALTSDIMNKPYYHGTSGSM
jgi:hypothetical protein